MTSAQEHELHVLNELIVAALDSVGGDGVGGETSSASDDSLEDDHLDSRLTIVESLQIQVRALNGTPASEGSILAAAYAAMRRSARNGSRDARDDSVAESDGLLAQRFLAALSDPQVSADVKAAIHAAFAKLDMK